MTYGQMVQQYKQIFSMVSAPLRGSPMALAALRAFEALPQMETMDLIEVKGLPGLRVEAILNGTAGDFDFFHKLGKEAGLVEVLKNTSTAFFSVSGPATHTAKSPSVGRIPSILQLSKVARHWNLTKWLA